MERKLYLYNLEKQAITVEFEGVTAKYVSDFAVNLVANGKCSSTVIPQIIQRFSVNLLLFAFSLEPKKKFTDLRGFKDTRS